MLDYYNQLFTSSNPNDFDEIIGAIQPKVTPSMNHALAKVFIADEARVTLKQMYPLKAPSPDGMSPLFFQHF